MQVHLRTLAADFGQAMLEQQQAYDAVLAQVQQRAEPLTGYLFVGEHAPVYTLGKHGNPENLLPNASQTALPPLFPVDRGGDITYHGPGQIVVYLVLYLPALKLAAKRYILALETAVLNTLSDFGIAGETLADAPGVWLPPTTNQILRKICALGIHINRGITTHGLALNVSTDLRYFQKINPCGFTDRGVTTMQIETSKSLTLNEINKHLLQHLATTLNLAYITV